MKIELFIPDYTTEKGIQYEWQDGFIIKIDKELSAMKISANKEGLMSLANHIINLAQNNIPSGYHMHFDEFNSLETGSVDLVIQKM